MFVEFQRCIKTPACSRSKEDSPMAAATAKAKATSCQLHFILRFICSFLVSPAHSDTPETHACIDVTSYLTTLIQNVERFLILPYMEKRKLQVDQNYNCDINNQMYTGYHMIMQVGFI